MIPIWNIGLCLHAPWISEQELISWSGMDLESLTISIRSLLHRAQVDFPKVIVTILSRPTGTYYVVSK
jgi:hypothetical protein